MIMAATWLMGSATESATNAAFLHPADCVAPAGLCDPDWHLAAVLVFGIWYLVFGVWYLGSGVWGLGPGVWGLGCTFEGL